MGAPTCSRGALKTLSTMSAADARAAHGVRAAIEKNLPAVLKIAIGVTARGSVLRAVGDELVVDSEAVGECCVHDTHKADEVRLFRGHPRKDDATRRRAEHFRVEPRFATQLADAGDRRAGHGLLLRRGAFGRDLPDQRRLHAYSSVPWSLRGGRRQRGQRDRRRCGT